ncbi:unnamed protein product [Protopolystoma xenopodis]|uniref:Uncharacterized protein n=1 Tax=Protopolystoma xenopodis TaxID=117903 RepID=A0A3S5CL87_9PLAT|nr:unnamed protein product [Protopolystoma xenopodis]
MPSNFHLSIFSSTPSSLQVILLIGGRGVKTGGLDSIDLYDVRLNTWILFPTTISGKNTAPTTSENKRASEDETGFTSIAHLPALPTPLFGCRAEVLEQPFARVMPQFSTLLTTPDSPNLRSTSNAAPGSDCGGRTVDDADLCESSWQSVNGIYVTGGNSGGRAVATVYQMPWIKADEPSTTLPMPRWCSDLSPMLEARAEHGMTVLDGKIYVVGGTDGDKSMYSHLSSYFLYV